MGKRYAALVVGALVASVAVAAQASAATLADWEMNEGPGATVMVDSSGHVNGTIGSGVQTGFSFNGATAYHWVFTLPTAPPAQPERVITASSNTLNPGTGNYTLSVRFRTTQHFGNIVQKGQAGSVGGYYKMENPNGMPRCLFKGQTASGGYTIHIVQSPTVLSDNQWQTVTCTRTANKVTLAVNGTVVATSNGPTGNISNTAPEMIAGKIYCDQISTTCDYFTGDIDYIKISNDAPTGDTSPPTFSKTPDARMAVGTQIGSTVPVTLSWLAQDASRVCSYALQQQINSGAVTNVPLDPPSRTSIARGLKPSTNVYHFGVRATDCAQNSTGFVTGPTAQMVSNQNDAGKITYSAGWRKLSVAGTAGGTITSTSKAGASASLTFSGRQIGWVASKSKARGQAAVYIDGTRVKTVNLYTTSLRHKRIVFTHGWTTNGTHTIKIVCLGTKGHPAVDIDTLLVLR